MSVLKSQPQNPTPDPVESQQPQSNDRIILISILVVCGVPAMIGLVLGNVVIKIAVVLVALAMLYGWARGLSGTLSVLVGLVVAIVLAQPLSGLLSGLMSGITGSSGLLNRMASIGASGFLVFVIVSMALSIPLQRTLKNRPSWQRADKIGGIGIGLIEGLIFALGFIWVPQALEPIASMQTSSDATQATGTPNPLAEKVVWLAQRSRESSIGRGVGSINPVSSARPLTMADDFLRLTRDEEALRRFNESDIAQEIRSLPSVEQALTILESDPALMSRIEEEGASPDVIRDLLESPTVLRVLDETTLVADLSASVEGLQQAMRDAMEPESAARTRRQ